MKRKSENETKPKKKIVEIPFPEQNAIFYDEAKDDQESFLGIDCCAVCGKKKNLIDCPKCEKISYCSNKHMEKDHDVHEKVCHFLKMVSEDENLEISKEDLKKSVLSVKYKDESTFWKDLFPSNIAWDSAKARKLSNFLSYPFTLLYCIEKYNLSQIKIIHVIGASKQEMEYLEIWKILFKKFENLKISMVGPELKRDGSFDVVNNGKLQCVKKKYHEFLADNKEKPDMIVGYHLGLTVPDYEWVESIKQMKSFKKYILLTGFSRDEILMDYNEIEEHIKLKIKIEPQLNPFASMTIQQSGTLANDLYKNNLYFSIFEKK